MEVVFTNPVIAYEKFQFLLSFGAVGALIVVIAGQATRGKRASNYFAGLFVFLLLAGAGYESNLNVFYKLKASDGVVKLYYVFPQERTITVSGSVNFKFSPGRGGCQVVIYDSGDRHKSSETRNVDCKSIAHSLASGA